VSQKNQSIESCFAALGDRESALVLATVIQAIPPTSGKVGNKALVSAEKIVEGWIGGGCSQSAVVRVAEHVLRSGRPCVIRVGPEEDWSEQESVIDFTSGCLSGGTLLIFVEPLVRNPTLSILGNSPVAQNLSVLAQNLGFSVTVVSPDVDPDSVADDVNFSKEFTDLDCDFIVIATQGRHDRAALNAAIESSANYIAMIASRKKFAGLTDRLANAGVSSCDLQRIHNPAGIDIGAVTPQEIALSILADLVRERRNAAAKTLKPKKLLANESQPAAADGGCCGG